MKVWKSTEVANFLPAKSNVASASAWLVCNRAYDTHVIWRAARVFSKLCSGECPQEPPSWRQKVQGVFLKHKNFSECSKMKRRKEQWVLGVGMWHLKAVGGNASLTVPSSSAQKTKQKVQAQADRGSALLSVRHWDGQGYWSTPPPTVSPVFQGCLGKGPQYLSEFVLRL